jgi:hypothetical protein
MTHTRRQIILATAGLVGLTGAKELSRPETTRRECLSPSGQQQLRHLYERVRAARTHRGGHPFIITTRIAPRPSPRSSMVES